MSRPLLYAALALIGLLVAYSCGKLVGVSSAVEALRRDAAGPLTAEQTRALATLEFGRLFALLAVVLFWAGIVPCAAAVVVFEAFRWMRGR